jgi:hypothetical protein
MALGDAKLERYCGARLDKTIRFLGIRLYRGAPNLASALRTRSRPKLLKLFKLLGQFLKKEALWSQKARLRSTKQY